MASISDQQIEDKRLLARAEDALAACREHFTARFIGFLDERQAQLVRTRLARERADVTWRFFGGHKDAERVMLGVFSEDYPATDDQFPIVPMAFGYRCDAVLTHRDVLGSLLGCGIVREKVGDILCDTDKAIVFMHEALAAFVAEEVTGIGRVGVKVILPYEGELPPMHRFAPVTGTVASARLDAVLKVLLGISREEASDTIRSALVSINHQPSVSVSETVRAGSVISVRGSGRFVIDELCDLTKKGRLILKARRYI